ncbi:MAG: RNA 2',3'-cyclic phosphodiesterase [Candidatus Omnitrophica bacterium]|nr:RNA 2',3'-cyclic phosphodiesterase [Candidatus Omnitrophota bacterium]MCF7892504.1 RNA 2',3'-cyclic phosphodiesterase [Candidatus Omnitrophota bacterium]MCF7895730.1 RNA 2',3'-cyclic phosphodiesterase [Candidatus Omnitrophota bacterium]MCF7897621.1 RNA 2',3'-cyclic phosphodiesterase [Candidatus Omnitrophota bacterium]MCF7909593.1 RNA 2',3'-cyclic phosphodiesterase [Candidatus Omnitrophota bacterium]
MRAFIGLDLTNQTKAKIKEVTDKLESLPIKAKWVNNKNLHITLKFLGNINQEQLDTVKKIIAGISGRYNPFELHLKSFGFFPNSRKPRIFFISFCPGKRLEALSESLGKRLNQVGFKEDKKFRPHITLARIKSLKNIKQLSEKINQLKAESKFKINKISLFKSTLTQKGPIYQEIFKANLKN